MYEGRNPAQKSGCILNSVISVVKSKAKAEPIVIAMIRMVQINRFTGLIVTVG